MTDFVISTGSIFGIVESDYVAVNDAVVILVFAFRHNDQSLLVGIGYIAGNHFKHFVNNSVLVILYDASRNFGHRLTRGLIDVLDLIGYSFPFHIVEGIALLLFTIRAGRIPFTGGFVLGNGNGVAPDLGEIFHLIFRIKIRTPLCFKSDGIAYMCKAVKLVCNGKDLGFIDALTVRFQLVIDDVVHESAGIPFGVQIEILFDRHIVNVKSSLVAIVIPIEPGNQLSVAVLNIFDCYQLFFGSTVCDSQVVGYLEEGSIHHVSVKIIFFIPVEPNSMNRRCPLSIQHHIACRHDRIRPEHKFRTFRTLR